MGALSPVAPWAVGSGVSDSSGESSVGLSVGSGSSVSVSASVSLSLSVQANVRAVSRSHREGSVRIMKLLRSRPGRRATTHDDTHIGR